jgi:hypothetical protein
LGIGKWVILNSGLWFLNSGLSPAIESFPFILMNRAMARLPVGQSAIYNLQSEMPRTAIR